MWNVLKVLITESGIYILAAALAFALWFSINKAEKYKTKADTLETTITDLNQQIKYAEVRLNDSVKVYQAQVKDLNMTAKNIEARYKDLLKASKVNAKDVDKVTEVVTVVHSTDTVIAYKDSFGGLNAKLVDPFVDIDVEVLPNLNAVIDYEVRDSLTIINVQKKHSWLFGLIKWKEHKETRVINKNPKADVVGLQVIDVFE